MTKHGVNRIVYGLLFAAILVLFFAGGGLLVTVIEERVDPRGSQYAVLLPAIVLALATAVLAGRRLYRGAAGTPTGRKHFWFTLVLFGMLMLTTLVLLNGAARFHTVKWPMSGLHGVSSEVGQKAWEYHEDRPDFVRVNSWGQRDREHALLPAPGTYRMVFVGDSYLENGAPVPVPLRTESYLRAMGKGSVEAINLGVTATDTDEYYYRLQRVGLPLQPQHCVLMFAASTDFIQQPTLLSYYGISATYPRLSFLQLLGLGALDQVISNERRPILRAWFKGEPLLKHELELKALFGKTGDDRETEELYLSFFPPDQRQRVQATLARATADDRQRFFSMLRHPDDNSFFSFYLDVATNVAKGMEYPFGLDDSYAFKWVEKIRQLCQRQGMAFTLVLIPDGFTVDSRMAGYYRAIADMKAFMTSRDEALTRMVRRATAAGMDVVDLRDLLRQHPGSYLNMDGHWSQLGADTVARYLAEKFAALGLGTANKGAAGQQ